LTQLKVSGGTAEKGGAIYSSSASLKLDNCVFDGNTATDGNDGAVWANGGSVTIVGGEFLGNNASRFGGAVHATESRLEFADATVTDSVFSGNYAQSSGGALCGGLMSNMSVNGCTFGNNTSEQDGSAISASSMRLGGNTQLEDNSANNRGGAV
ncbi:unnamed protein product, partial [Laminaria digitata]